MRRPSFPNCTQCTTTTHCSDRATNVTANANKTACECSCSPGFTGSTCNQCATGYMNYPNCTKYSEAIHTVAQVTTIVSAILINPTSLDSLQSSALFGGLYCARPSVKNMSQDASWTLAPLAAVAIQICPLPVHMVVWNLSLLFLFRVPRPSQVPLHYCPRTHRVCALLLHFLWNAECLLDVLKEPAYTDVFPVLPGYNRGFDTLCECGFKDKSLIPSMEYRTRLCSHVVKSVRDFPITKNSAHRAKTVPLLKDPVKAAAKRQEKEDEKLLARQKAQARRAVVAASKKTEEKTEVPSQRVAPLREKAIPKRRAEIEPPTDWFNQARRDSRKGKEVKRRA